jgi:hypothetical protein
LTLAIGRDNRRHISTLFDEFDAEIVAIAALITSANRRLIR